MSAWVRDLPASGRSVGLLLADGAYQNRPTEMAVYEGFDDQAWHQLTRTSTATARGSKDTGVYVALPDSGPMSVQVTAVSVHEVATSAPTPVSQPAARTISFTGPAGPAPAPGSWNHETGGNGWGNGELQTYTDRTANAHVDGQGNLVLSALRETYAASDGITRKYTSARLSTEGKVVLQPVHTWRPPSPPPWASLCGLPSGSSVPTSVRWAGRRRGRSMLRGVRRTAHEGVQRRAPGHARRQQR